MLIHDMIYFDRINGTHIGARSVKAIANQYGMEPKYLFVAPPAVEKLKQRLLLRYCQFCSNFFFSFINVSGLQSVIDFSASLHIAPFIHSIGNF